MTNFSRSWRIIQFWKQHCKSISTTNVQSDSMSELCFCSFFSHEWSSFIKKKIHQNANEFSKLFYEWNSSKFELNMSINVISNGDDFLKKIANEFFVNRIFVKVMKKLKNQIEKIKNNDENFVTKYQIYKLNFEIDLLYVKNKSNFDKICIFEKCQKAFLKYEHDQHVHNEIHRTYDLLHKSVFIFRIKKLMIEYVINCSICQFFKSFKQFSYEKLQSISLFSKLLFELNLNFIIALSIIFQKNNCILTMTNRFSKYIKVVSKKKLCQSKNEILYTENTYLKIEKFLLN